MLMPKAASSKQFHSAEKLELMKISASLIGLAFLFPLHALAQGTGPAVIAEEDQIETDEASDDKSENDGRIFTFVIENDSIGGQGTDKNYTSGVRFSYYDKAAKVPEIFHEIDDYIPTFEVNSQSRIFYSLGQNIYTPTEISQSVQDPNDRPWAAHLYASVGLVTDTGNHRDELEISFGVVGPWALGKQAQSFVHKYVTPDSPTPKGWSSQLDNEPALLLGWRRQFKDYFKTTVGGFSASASPHYGVTLGNVYTFASGGLSFSLSPKNETWQDAPVRVRPSMPGTGVFEIPEDGWSWYLFAGLEGRAVARNIFLDGNTFDDSHNVDKNYFVADANAGLALTYGQYRVSYTLAYRTSEFKGQDDPSVFGALSFGYQF